MTATTFTNNTLARQVGCIIDYDNWIRNPFGANDGLDYFGIKKLLGDLGARQSTLCANWLRPAEDVVLSALGFRTRVAGKNADPVVIEEALKLADAGCNTIIIGSGDADYLDLCKSLVARGIKIVLVAKRASVAKAMLQVASGVYFLDRYCAPRRRSVEGVRA